MQKIIFVLVLIVHFCRGIIYRLNDEMYNKMPPVFQFEDYEPCMSEPDGVYCMTKFALVSDTNSELLNMIHNFSKHQVRHYNHSKLHYGVCLTTTCAEYYYNGDENRDLRVYDILPYHTFINGTLVVQVFFLMTGFLLAFTVQMKSEKMNFTWVMIPIEICRRWLRLTPVYAVVLAITSTWLRFFGSGPMWNEEVVKEAEDCRCIAWRNLLYINNYFDDKQCLVQAWYLAADMQLYCLGVFICLMVTNSTVRKVVLSLLFAAGVIIPAVVTYVKDLDAVLIVSPETCIHYFIKDPTFNYVYKRGHTNLAGWLNINIPHYKHLWIYQLLFPTTLIIAWLGSVFFRDAPRDSIYIRALYAGIMKPVSTLLLALFILGAIFKCDKITRNILEWRRWVTPARLSYSAYVLHLSVIRTYIGTSETQTNALFLNMAFTSISMVILAFLLATPLWLLVEAPANELVRMTFSLLIGAQETKKTDGVRLKIT
ncbi:unnamed protein product [Parnassius apollo]|uniref:(apollo) hypothetical protein n=1 Tax=Parnassius apollo TaxID=110799 RepID=A0A8S3XZ74_PARAO|nr:unnamed protein product [Parnassius apollo]